MSAARKQTANEMALAVLLKEANRKLGRVMGTLERIAASDPRNRQFATLVLAEAREAIEEVTGEPWPVLNSQRTE